MNSRASGSVSETAPAGWRHLRGMLLSSTAASALIVFSVTAPLGVVLSGAAQAQGFPASSYPVIHSNEGLYYPGPGPTVYGPSTGAPWTVTNQGTVVNYGAGSGIKLYSGTITNSGLIRSDHGIAAMLVNGGLITNNASGTITGVQGIGISSTGTVINAGTIIGTGGTAVGFGAGNDLLQILPGAKFVGIADGGAGSNTLELAAGTLGNTGTLVGFGTSFTNFGTVTVDSGARWNVSGGVASGVTLTNAGMLTNSGTILSTVTLTGSGSITNTNSGLISARDGIVSASANSGTVTNSGTIIGSSAVGNYGRGISFTGTGAGTVFNSGSISAANGVYMKNAGYVQNLGTITATRQVGVSLAHGGTIINGSSSNTTALIETTANNFGAYGGLGALTLTNYGTIASGGWVGVVANSGGTVTNFGQIRGAIGLYMAGGTLTNHGTITSTAATALSSGIKSAGVYLNGGAGLTNAADGTISGWYGIYNKGAATITNAGTITGNGTTGVGVLVSGNSANTLINTGTIIGNGGTAIRFGGGNDLLQLQSGATFVGLVDGGTGTNTLEFVSGTGTMPTFTNFGVVKVDSGADWTSSGSIGAGVTLTDAGTLTNAGTIASTVTLTGTGSLTNQLGGRISGNNGVYASSAATPAITNLGTITGTGSNGVFLNGGGTVTNQGTASTIRGNNYGIYVNNGPLTLTNAGTISTTNLGGVYVYNASGVVTNLASGIISGNSVGLELHQNGTVSNFGSITASNGYGVSVDNGLITNQSLAVIQGGSGIQLGSGTLLNSGTITATDTSKAGVRINNGAAITNYSAGQITGGSAGIQLFANSTVTNYGHITATGATGAGIYASAVAGMITNAGTISATGSSGVGVLFTGSAAGTLINSGAIIGNGGTAVRFGTGNDLLEMTPGAVFSGIADGGSGTNTLELTAGTLGNTGTLTGLGTSFVNFGVVKVDSGANWTSSGSIGTGVTLTDAGMLTNAGTIASTVTLTGTGKFTNTNSGRISGAIGVLSASASSGTVVNSGSIAGTTYGVKFTGTGAGTVLNSGVISGASSVYLKNPGYVQNLGSIVSTGTAMAVRLQNGGTLVNGSTSNTTALIDGSTAFFAVYSNIGVTHITNYGTILSGLFGVNLNSAGTVTNSGRIAAALGVYMVGGTFSNSGTVIANASTNTITGPSSGHYKTAGVYMKGATSVMTNAASGTITGWYGAYLSSGGSVQNLGTIIGSGTTNSAGIVINGPGIVTNAGTISATGTASIGVLFKGSSADTLVNSGTIIGNGGTAVRFGSGNDLLQLQSGATFVGLVDGGTGTNTLEFVSGTGTMPTFTNFGVVTVDSGANWSSSGLIGAGVTFTNAGTFANAGTILSTVTLTGTGILSNSGTMSSATGTAVSGNGAAGVVSNTGQISGLSGYGVHLTAGGSVTNTTGASTISGVAAGVSIDNGVGIVNNAGTITGTGTAGVGVLFTGTGANTLVNSGTIIGNGGTAVRFGSGDDLLQIQSGATFVGQVDGGAGTNTLEFVSGTGTVSNIVNFGVVKVDSGADWSLSGSVGAGVTLTNAGTFANTGAILSTVTLAGAGIVTNSGTIGGVTGLVFTGTGGSVTNSGTITGSGGVAVQFAAGVNTLNLGTGSVLNGSINGGGGAGVIALTGTGAMANTITNFGAGSAVTIANGANWTTSGSWAVAGVTNTGSLTNSGSILTAGGGFTNTGSLTNTGTISGVTGLIFTGTGGSVTNNGTIIGSGGVAVQFAAGVNTLSLGTGSVLNGSIDGGGGAGVITLTGTGTMANTITNFGAGSAVTIANGANWSTSGSWTVAGVTNAGTVANAGAILSTVTLTGTGSLSNSGTISGANGVYGGSGFTGIVTNTGTILGTGVGVDLTGGKLVNNAGGYIKGGQYGVVVGAGGTIANAGTILDNVMAGASVGSNGVLTNDTTGTIGGVTGLIFTGTGGSVTNSGTITGTGGVAVQFAAGVNTLTIGTGSVLNGSIDGGGGAGLINLTGTGTMANTITNFGAGSAVTIANGANWGTSGSWTVAGVTNTGSLTNSGSILTSGGGFTNTGSLTNSGTIGGVTGLIFTGTGGSVTNSGTITGTGGVAVQFAAGVNTLTIGTGSVLNGSIDGGGGAGLINLTGTGTMANTITNFGAGSALTIANGANWSTSGSWTVAGVTNTGILTNSGGILTAGGGFTNTGSLTNTGTISGVTGLIFTGTGGSVTNSGTITGSGGVAVQFAAGVNTLNLGTGSVLNGSIDGGGGAGLIALTGTGTMANTITNFGAGSAVTIANGANWTTSGSWTAASVVNNGTLQPGTLTVPLKVTGNFTQTSSGVLQVALDASGAGSALEASGTASLAGSVTVVPTGTFVTASTKYTIVKAAGGVSGSFSSITAGTLLLTPSLSYDANDAYVTLTQQNVGGGGTSPPVFTKTANEQAVAAAFDAGNVADPTTFAQALLGLDQFTEAADLKSALDRLAGENNADLATSALLAGRQFISQFQQHSLLTRSTSDIWSIWGSAYTGKSDLDGGGNTHSFKQDVTGVTGGIDYRLNPLLRIGAAFGYGFGSVSLGDKTGHVGIDYKQIALTGDYLDGPIYLDGLIGGSFGSGTTSRDVSLPGLPAQASAHVSDSQFLAAFEAGYAFPIRASVTLTPFAGVNIGAVNENGFTESGAGAVDLKMAGYSTTGVQSILGSRLMVDIPLSDAMLKGDFKLGWAHEFATTHWITQSFAGTAGTNFTVEGAQQPGDGAAIGAGLSATIFPDASAYVHYDGDLASKGSTHSFSAGFRFGW